MTPTGRILVPSTSQVQASTPVSDDIEMSGCTALSVSCCFRHCKKLIGFQALYNTRLLFDKSMQPVVDAPQLPTSSPVLPSDIDPTSTQRGPREGSDALSTAGDMDLDDDVVTGRSSLVDTEDDSAVSATTLSICLASLSSHPLPFRIHLLVTKRHSTTPNNLWCSIVQGLTGYVSASTLPCSCMSVLNPAACVPSKTSSDIFNGFTPRPMPS